MTSCLTCGPWRAPLRLSDMRAACWCHMLVGEGGSGSLKHEEEGGVCDAWVCAVMRVVGYRPHHVHGVVSVAPPGDSPLELLLAHTVRSSVVRM